MFLPNDVADFVSKRIHYFPYQNDFIAHQKAKITSLEHEMDLLSRRIVLRNNYGLTNPSHIRSNKQKIDNARLNLVLMQKTVNLRKKVVDYISTTPPAEWERLKTELK